MGTIDCFGAWLWDPVLVTASPLTSATLCHEFTYEMSRAWTRSLYYRKGRCWSSWASLDVGRVQCDRVACHMPCTLTHEDYCIRIQEELVHVNGGKERNGGTAAIDVCHTTTAIKGLCSSHTDLTPSSIMVTAGARTATCLGVTLTETAPSNY